MPHVFISYVREDSESVRELARSLKSAGIKIWLDREELDPGVRWQDCIRRAIREGSFFIACFSRAYEARNKTYMNEELTLAIEELRKRTTDQTWFIPVLLNSCEIPDKQIGGGETLHSIQSVSLHENWKEGIDRILKVVGADPIFSKKADAYRKNHPLQYLKDRFPEHPDMPIKAGQWVGFFQRHPKILIASLAIVLSFAGSVGWKYLLPHNKKGLADSGPLPSATDAHSNTQLPTPVHRGVSPTVQSHVNNKELSTEPQEARVLLDDLQIRVATMDDRWEPILTRLHSVGQSPRSDIATALKRLRLYSRLAAEALKAGDVIQAKRQMSLAEKQLAFLEQQNPE